MYKTGKVASILTIDPQTVKNWIDNPLLSEFFSPDAKGEGRVQRKLTDRDLLVLNTIRVKRAENAEWHEIAALLKSGYLDRALPVEGMRVDTGASTLQQIEKNVTTVAERDRALGLLREREEQIRDRNRRIAELEAELEKAKEERHKYEVDRERIIAALETELKLYREGRIKPDSSQSD